MGVVLIFMTRFDFCYKAALLNGILKRIYKVFPKKYDCTQLYSCYLFEIIAIFWREKSQNLLVLESSFQEQRSKHLFFGKLFSTDSNLYHFLYMYLLNKTQSLTFCAKSLKSQKKTLQEAASDKVKVWRAIILQCLQRRNCCFLEKSPFA